MKERPIIFSSEMVKAILKGRKTMTRRIIDFKKIAKKTGCTKGTLAYSDTFNSWAVFNGDSDVHLCLVNCPYGEIGDVLYVRESFHIWEPEGVEIPHYKATNKDPVCDKAGWKPSIHMPKKFARIFLEITKVRVEKVNNISEEDSLAEGIKHNSVNDPRVEFQWLWDSINEKRGYGWDKNPFVWVIEFKKKEAQND